jgi:hypothetical protein
MYTLAEQDDNSPHAAQAHATRKGPDISSPVFALAGSRTEPSRLSPETLPTALQ